jgi:hypothetical protein
MITKQFALLCTITLMIFVILYLSIDFHRGSTTEATDMAWGEFQLIHNEQVDRLTSTIAPTQSAKQMYKWIIDTNSN